MAEARETLSAKAAPLPPVQEAQSLAISDLQKALELLSPPPPPPEDPGSDEQEQEDQGESEQGDSEDEAGQDDGSGAAPEEGPQQEMDDPSQLLQGVRDREAARRRERDQEAQRRRAVPVEKDW
jgi:hypothetical protein